MWQEGGAGKHGGTGKCGLAAGKVWLARCAACGGACAE